MVFILDSGLHRNDENKLLYSGADSAFISRNVCLYCAAEGLATGVRSFVHKDELAKSMKLRERQKTFWYRQSAILNKLKIQNWGRIYA